MVYFITPTTLSVFGDLEHVWVRAKNCHE
jgi:hypothetical protein